MSPFAQIHHGMEFITAPLNWGGSPVRKAGLSEVIKSEYEKQWEEAIGSLIPEPRTLGLVAEEKKTRRRSDEVTVVYGLDPRIKREVEPLTQSLGSAFEEVGL